MKKNLVKLCAIGVLAALIAVAAVGCGSGGSSSSSKSASGTPKTTQLTFGCQNYGKGLVDPANQTNSAWNAVRYGITECLFKFDDSMNVKGWLATDDYKVSDDHKTWTFNIRKDAKFSSGEPLTPSAIVASIQRLWADGASGSATPEKYLERSAQLTADDANWTLTIQTETAYVDLRKNMAYPVMAIVDVKNTTDYEHGVIGTGPYAIESYTADVGYKLKKNANYYENVPFETVDLKYLGDATAKANALKSGQIILTENIATATDLEALKSDSAYTVNVANGVRCGFSYINMAGKLKNDALRQAVQMAIDGKTIAEKTVGGLYTYGYSVLPSNLDYNYDKLTNPFAFDQSKAKDTLDKANIKDTDGDGIREIDGAPIKLKWLTYENRGLADMAQAGQQQLKEIGIDVEMVVTDSETEWNMLVNGDYDLLSNNWITVGTGDPTEYLANWAGGNPANYCNYSNEKYTAAYNALLTEMDTAKRTELIQTMQQCLLDDGAVLVHGYYNSSMIFANCSVSSAPIHTADYYWLTSEVTPAS